jgi:hypothetical protein
MDKGGVNSMIFTQVSNLPFVPIFESSIFRSELYGNYPNLAEEWGSYSVKYIVVYASVAGSSDVTSRLSSLNGIVQVASLTDVLVYQDQYAKPVAHSNDSSLAATQITYNDPTNYRVLTTASAPFLLILNQIYSDEWVASVNGVSLPISDHVKLSNNVNGWNINRTGTFTINLHYASQTIYTASMIVSSGTIIGILVYLGATGLGDSRSAKMRTNPETSCFRGLKHRKYPAPKLQISSDEVYVFWTGRQLS